MTTSLLTRIARLEARPQTAGTPLLRHGWIDRLPSAYTGERHFAMVKREPTRAPNIEWCQFVTCHQTTPWSTLALGGALVGQWSVYRLALTASVNHSAQ